MWIKLENNIFQSPNNSQDLIYLLNLAFRKSINTSNIRCKILIEEDSITNKSLSKMLTSTDEEFLYALFEEYYGYEEPVNFKYIVSNTPKNYYLEEVIRILEQPIKIILENGTNDSYFIKSIIWYFNDNDNILKDYLDNNWIEFDNGGGSGIKNHIRGSLSKFDSLATKYNKESHKYYRAFVVLDSDKKHPNDSKTLEGKKLLIQFLNDNSISYHILDKRSMENYMPDEVIDEIKNNKKSKSKKTDSDKKCSKWTHLYQSLTHEQKDFLKYEKQEEFKKLPIEAQNLYKNISVTDYQILVNGIGYTADDDSLDDDEKKFKNAFPKHFVENSLINKYTLNRRCGTDELQEIYNKIKSLL